MMLFESDFRHKLLFVSFKPQSQLQNTSDIQSWKEAWTKELAGWHSPYKAIIDLRELQMATTHPDLKPALERLFAFLAKFFLKKAVAWGGSAANPADLWPIPWVATEDEALALLQVRGARSTTPGDFRSQIMIDNHFEQQVVEINFGEPVTLEAEHVRILRSKLTNNLTQWHSRWSLLIDCSKLTISEVAHEEFRKMEKFLSGFFLDKIVGYNPMKRGMTYPFPCYLARHRAAAELKDGTTASGRKANCNERKSS
jgi:hypothetical protein